MKPPVLKKEDKSVSINGIDIEFVEAVRLFFFGILAFFCASILISFFLFVAILAICIIISIIGAML